MATDQAEQGSNVDYCSRWPEEGHSWVWTLHGGLPPVSTRTCHGCKYLDVTGVREQITSLTTERDRLRDDERRWNAAANELLPRFDALVDAITALIPDDYDSDDAVEAIILRWLKDVLADRKDVEADCDRWEREAARLADLEAKAKAWATAERNDDEFEFDIQRAKVALLTAIDAVVPHGQIALRDAVVEAARELPTDHVLHFIADAVTAAANARDAKRAIFYQSVLDEFNAFDALVDALDAGATTGDATP